MFSTWTYQHHHATTSVFVRSPLPSVVDDTCGDVNTHTLIPFPKSLSSTKRRKHKDFMESLLKKVYVTQPSTTGETLTDVARRQGSSTLMLSSYNPSISSKKVLPTNTCLITWEHSSSTASCFDLVEQRRSYDLFPSFSQVEVHSLVCTHVSQLHKHIHDTDVRIVPRTVSIPNHAKGFLSPSNEHPDTTIGVPSAVSYIALPTHCTIADLRNDPHLHIDWEFIATHPTKHPAVFENSRGNKFTFLFEKFMQNGNCKGKQILHIESKTTNYVNSAGLSTTQLYYRKGSTLPCRLCTTTTSVSSYMETFVNLTNNATLAPFCCKYDSRDVFVLPSGGDTRVLVAHTQPNPTRTGWQNDSSWHHNDIEGPYLLHTFFTIVSDCYL